CSLALRRLVVVSVLPLVVLLSLLVAVLLAAVVDVAASWSDRGRRSRRRRRRRRRYARDLRNEPCGRRAGICGERPGDRASRARGGGSGGGCLGGRPSRDRVRYL